MYLRVFVHEVRQLVAYPVPHRSRNLKNQPEAGAATDVVKMSVA
jgi:hypothetical protein